jgi:hypothetical protein
LRVSHLGRKFLTWVCLYFHLMGMKFHSLASVDPNFYLVTSMSCRRVFGLSGADRSGQDVHWWQCKSRFQRLNQDYFGDFGRKKCAVIKKILMPNFLPWKKVAKMWTTYSCIKKLPKLNNRPMGETLSNLVNLEPILRSRVTTLAL